MPQHSRRVRALRSVEPQQCGEEANAGAFGSGCFEGLLRPKLELIVVRRGGDGSHLPDMVVEPASIEVGSRPCQCPSLPVLPALTQPPQYPGRPGEVPGSLRPVSGAGSHAAVAASWGTRGITQHRSTWQPPVTAASSADCGPKSRLPSQSGAPTARSAVMSSRCWCQALGAGATWAVMEYATNTGVYFLLFMTSELSPAIQAQRVEAEQGNVAFPQKSPVS